MAYTKGRKVCCRMFAWEGQKLTPQGLLPDVRRVRKQGTFVKRRTGAKAAAG